MKIYFLRKARLIAALFFAFITAAKAQPDKDLPGPTANLVTVPGGSLVIAMDTGQLNDNGEFNVKVYGLLVTLLNNGIDLQWCIKAGKTKDAVDFTAVAAREFPYASASAFRYFSAGPFIILPQDTLGAREVIATYNSTLDPDDAVGVFRLVNNVNVDIRYTLNYVVRVGILRDGYHASVSATYMDLASIPADNFDSVYISQIATGCATFISETHASDPAVIAGIRTWCEQGGNLFVQCASINHFEANANGRFHTSQGYVIDNTAFGTIQYNNADLSVAQFLGAFNPVAISGTVQNFKRTSGGYQNDCFAVVNNSTNTDHRSVAGAKLANGVGGMVYYAGGHNYSNGTTVSHINGLRIYFNSMLTPTTKRVNGGCFTDTDGDGIVDVDDVDDDNDGVSDILEIGGNGATSFALSNGDPSADFDLDGTVNYRDTNYCTLNTQGVCASLDFDSDGKINSLDIDADGDGIVDNIEAQSTGGYIPTSGDDDNQNGLDDAYDLSEGGVAIVPVNTDAADLPDYLDMNSDNQGEPDLVEGWDTNGDGVAETSPSGLDSDNDGLDDAFDSNDSQFNPTNGQTPLSFPNADLGSAERDWRETQNAPPVVDNETQVINEDTQATGDATDAGDSDPDGTALLVTTTPLQTPSNGSIVLSANGTYTYTPNLNFYGSDLIVLQVCDQGLPLPSLCVSDTIFITVNPVNDSPVIDNENVSVPEDNSISGDLTNTGDFDVDNTVLTADVLPVLNPANGSISVLANGNYTYTPNPNFSGSDFAVIRICDNGFPLPALCANDTVFVTVLAVNDTPTITNDTVVTNEDTPYSGDLTGLLDQDIDGSVLVVNTTPILDVSNGSIVVNSDGTFTYIPQLNYFGSDLAVFDVCDSGVPLPALCRSDTVFITVISVNDRPVATDNTYSTIENTSVQGNVVTNAPADSDVDGNLDPGSVQVLNSTINGTLTLNADGTFNYTPASNFSGSDQFTYLVCDSGMPVLCDTAIVLITVNEVNQPPQLADAADVSTEDINATLCSTISDPDPGSVFTASVCGVDYGSAQATVSAGEVCISYSPPLDFNGQASVCVVVCDNGTPALCDTALYLLAVEAVNDPPVLANESYSTVEDSAITGNILTSDDYDPDTTELVLNTTPISGPLHGTISVNSDGSFTYTPNEGFYGEEVVVFEICDQGTPLPAICRYDTLFINVILKPDPVIPDNVFTPNGDGLNDTWHAFNPDAYPGTSVTILSRWGEVVFKSENYQNDFDGTNNMNGKKLADGTYYYFIQTSGVGSKQIKGAITILSSK